MHSLQTVVLVLALAPLAYYLIAILATVRFFQRERGKPLGDFAPPVSLLKPVRGVDFASEENFRSFCRQNYPHYEILFCVNERSDPAVTVIERLQAEFPERPIRILSGAPQVGSNRKVNNLILLAREAEHEFLVQSDADVRVGPDYIRRVIAPFTDPRTGVASCFYRGIAERSFWAEMEAVGAASEFTAGALVADWVEGVTFALGASVATRKMWLQKIGGYEALADFLADDYEIGYRVHKAGGNVVLSSEPVSTMYPAQGFKSFWEHQVRWARTTRLARPASFFAMIITHGLPWAVLAALLAPSGWMRAGYLIAYLFLRLLMAWVVGVWGIADEVLNRRWWLVPLRDALYFGVWFASFGSNRVVWSGVEYTIHKGKMEEQPASR